MQDIVDEGVRRAYQNPENKLRASILADPAFTRRNTRDNTPCVLHVTMVPGGSFCHHADSFAMIRGGHLDLCVLGAFEVAENGDIANWATSENDTAPAVGGAMDLAVGAKRLWAVMEHTTRDGRPRLVQRCTYPLTAPGCVTRVYTNLAVLDVAREGFRVVDMVPGLTREALQARTDAALC